MPESNSMEIDPPSIPSGAGVAQTVPALKDVNPQSVDIPNPGTDETQPAAADQPSESASNLMEVDATPSARTQVLETEGSAPEAATMPMQEDEPMALEERTGQTTDPLVITKDDTKMEIVTSTVRVEQDENDLQSAQPNIEASLVAESGEQGEPSLIQQVVTTFEDEQTSVPSGHTTITQLDRSTSVAPTDKRAVSTDQAVTVRTGYIFDPLMMLHCADGYVPTADSVVEIGSGHPEEPMRIKRIFLRLSEMGLIKRMKQLAFKQVTMDQILLVHSEDHWNKVQGTETLTDQYIQESKAYYDQLSLYVCRETAHCARLSCGGVIQACRSVCEGEVRNAIAIVRPPGHHAEPDEHMGFCFFNNVAVAAKEVQKQGLAKKVLILDWDVHHGNGTQRAFWEDPSVLYISLHRHDGGKFYPTSDFGALDMVGQGAGEGTSVNVPWPSGGFGDGDYIYAFQKIIMPIAYEFNPDLVIISAGFDAAEGDQLGACNVSPAAYGHMTHMLCALAGGRVVVALEGGYNLEAISRSSLSVAQVLLGETPAELGQIEASEVATEVIHQVAKVQSKYWKSIDVKACEPPEVTSAPENASVIPIPDLLKIHRAHHLFTKHNLFQIPLASQELEEAFGGQVVCSENVYEPGKDSVLVVFVHDFGNLRVETDGVATTNVHMTNSYLLDTSDKVVDWIAKSKYSLIDVNVLAQLSTKAMSNGSKLMVPRGSKPEAQLMRYIWDNYIELSEAENIVLIGYGSGCSAIMDLINSRDVDRKVKAVVQVAGMHSLVRIDNDNQNRRDWFRKSNRIFVPNTHPLLGDDRAKKRLGGQIFTSEKAKVVDVLVDVLPRIEEFVTSMIPAQPSANGDALPARITSPEAVVA